MPVERPEREQKPIPPFALFEAISGQDSVLLQDALGFALWECFFRECVVDMSSFKGKGECC